MGFFFFLIIILFIIFAVLLNFGVAILRIIFNGLNPFSRNKNKGESRKSRNSYSQEREDEPKQKNKKIFNESDGEYVDFEEIK